MSFKGYFNNNKNINISFTGYCKRALSKNLQRGKFKYGWSFYGKRHSQIHVRYKLKTARIKQMKFWKHGEYYREYDVELIIVPPIRRNIWKTVQWVLPIMRQVKAELCQGGLKLRYIEVATDFMGKFVKKIHIDNFAACLLRGWSELMIRPDGIYDDNIYDGGNLRQRKNTCYPKENSWHWEARWTAKNLQRSKRASFEPQTIMELLLEMHRNMGIYYLDLDKLSRSALTKDWKHYWKLFLSDGIKFVVWAMGVNKIKNPKRKVSPHPLHWFFKKKLAGAIRQGVRMMQNLKQPINFQMLSRN